MVNVAIVCEGKNDQVFLKELISHLGFANDRANFYIFRGKSELFNPDQERYSDLKLETDAGQIGNILFVVDADNEQGDAIKGGYENTQTALNSLIEQLDIAAISQLFIVCDPTTRTGYLESLILSTIPLEQRNCIESFLACSQFRSKENHKAILNQIYKTAYPDAPYDFAHPHFDKLKLVLTGLFK